MGVIWWFTAVFGAIAVNLIACELFAWAPWLSECLMRRAVRRLAPEMQERMREEWAGHLQTIPPGLWRIVAAVGFYLAARQINVALRVRERQEKAAEEIEWLWDDLLIEAMEQRYRAIQREKRAGRLHWKILGRVSPMLLDCPSGARTYYAARFRLANTRFAKFLRIQHRLNPLREGSAPRLTGAL